MLQIRSPSGYRFLRDNNILPLPCINTIRQYFFFRCDRNNLTSNCRRGGGVLIAIRNDILCKLLPTSIFIVEHVFVKFTTNNVAFIVCSVCSPPNSPIHIYESFMSAVQTIISTHSDCVFLFCGDFNLPDVNGGMVQRKLWALLYFCPSVSNSSALDLIFTFNHELPSIDNTHNFFDFSKGCYTQICSFLTSFNWLLTITSLDIDSATHALYDALHYCVLNFVPEVNLLFGKKERSMQSMNQLSVLVTTLSFLLFGRNIRLSTKNVSEFLSRTEIQLNQNPRSFWDFVRKHKSGTGIPNSVSYNDITNVTSSGPESVPHIFSSYFNSVYLPNFHNHYDHGTPFSHHNLPNDCIFSVDDIDVGLSALKTGPDGLSGTFLFNIKSALCYPLWLLFRRSMDLGVFPKMLKMSSVTPIFKSGDKSDDHCTTVDSSLIERVQRRFLSSSAFILKINHPPHDYQPVMHKLGLVSLADRRVEVNLLFLHKLIDGSIDAPYLLAQVGFKSKTEQQRQGIIVLDEVYLMESLSVNSQTLTYMGLEDFGNELKTKGAQKANHALVFMWQSLADNLVQSIAVIASSGTVKGVDFSKLTVRAIMLMEDAGGQVVDLTCDGASTNRTMWSHLRVTCLSIKSNSIHKVCPKLTRNHFELNNLTKMKAKYAAEYVHCPLLKILNEVIEWITTWEDNLIHNIIKKDDFLTKATADGLKITLRSTINLVNYLLYEKDFAYVLTAKFNQDCLETSLKISDNIPVITINDLREIVKETANSTTRINKVEKLKEKINNIVDEGCWDIDDIFLEHNYTDYTKRLTVKTNCELCKNSLKNLNTTKYGTTADLVTAKTLELSFTKFADSSNAFDETCEDFFKNNISLPFPCADHRTQMLSDICVNYLVMRMRQYSYSQNQNNKKLNK
ncbi:Uncharacterized protein FWK35_00025159, partial [Aphis craccivora]